MIPEEVQEEQPELEDFTSNEDARSIGSELRKIFAPYSCVRW